MSKLTHIRKALQDNPNITIVGAPEQNYLPNRDNYWGHTVDFHVAPKTGSMYTAKELQTLMMSLIPGLRPTYGDDFREEDHEMMFGKLYFDENIGMEVVRREIVLTDKDMFSSGGFVDGKQIIEYIERIKRRTWVRLFPNTQIAAAVLEGKNKFYIPKNNLPKHHSIIAHTFL